MPVMIKNVPFAYFTGESGTEYTAFAQDCEISHEEYVVITYTESGSQDQIGLAKVTRTDFGMIADMVVYSEFIQYMDRLYPVFNGYSRQTKDGIIQKAHLTEINLSRYSSCLQVMPMGHFEWKNLETIAHDMA